MEPTKPTNNNQAGNSFTNPENTNIDTQDTFSKSESKTFDINESLTEKSVESKPTPISVPPSSSAPLPASTPSPTLTSVPRPTSAFSGMPKPDSGFKPYVPQSSAQQSPVTPRPTHSPISTTPSYTPSSMSSPTASPFSAPNSNSTSPSPTPTTTNAKLSEEVNTILNKQQIKTPSSNEYIKKYGMIGGIVLLVLLLLGGGYYWYTTMSKDATDPNADMIDQTNTSTNNRPTSVFPSAVTGTVRPQPTTGNTSGSATRVVTPFTQLQRSIISSYITANISRLSPVSTTGTFTVTEVTFDGPDRALVSYTDGRNSYLAIAVASIDTNDTVRILSFDVLEK